MAKSNLTKMANFNTSIREIDFVSRFARNWDALMNLFGIMRPIEKVPGTKLTSTVATVTLQSGAVGEGEEIPYSLAEVHDIAYEDIVFDKHCKAVSIESVAKYGADKAINKTDEAFLNELQNGVLTDFYTYLKTGILTGAFSTFQMALSMARGMVIDKFQKMQKTVTEVVGFANVLDAYKYLGGANVTIQTAFGMSYIENFLGYKTLFLMSDPLIPRGKVIALPVDNIDLYYINPADSDFAKLGLEFTVDGVTPLLGFHAMGNYSTAVGECYALMGMKLWAEFLDGIAVIDIGSESFSSVGEPSGSPFEKNYSEKDANNNYFHSIDTTVDGTKTYYSRTVTPAA